MNAMRRSDWHYANSQRLASAHISNDSPCFSRRGKNSANEVCASGIRGCMLAGARSQSPCCQVHVVRAINILPKVNEV